MVEEEEDDYFRKLPVEVTARISTSSDKFRQVFLPIIRLNFNDMKSRHALSFTKACVIHNPHLKTLYDAKKNEMQESAESDKNDCYAFAAVKEEQLIDICTNGMRTNNVNCSLLGNPEKGVCLQKYSDILSPVPFQSGDRGIFAIFKLIKGRTYWISKEITNMKQNPMSNYDCHMPIPPNAGLHNLEHEDHYHSSQYYIYDYGSNGVLNDCPRQILPVIFISYLYTGMSTEKPFKFKYRVWKGKLVSRNGLITRVELRSHSAKYIPGLSSYTELMITTTKKMHQIDQDYFIEVPKFTVTSEMFSLQSAANVLCLQLIAVEKNCEVFVNLMKYYKDLKVAVVIQLETMMMILLPNNDLSSSLGGIPRFRQNTEYYALITSKDSFMDHDKTLLLHRKNLQLDSQCLQDELISSFGERFARVPCFSSDRLANVFAVQHNLDEHPSFEHSLQANGKIYEQVMAKAVCETSSPIVNVVKMSENHTSSVPHFSSLNNSLPSSSPASVSKSPGYNFKIDYFQTFLQPSNEICNSNNSYVNDGSFGSDSCSRENEEIDFSFQIRDPNASYMDKPLHEILSEDVVHLISKNNVTSPENLPDYLRCQTNDMDICSDSSDVGKIEDSPYSDSTCSGPSNKFQKERCVGEVMNELQHKDKTSEQMSGCMPVNGIALHNYQSDTQKCSAVRFRNQVDLYAPVSSHSAAVNGLHFANEKSSPILLSESISTKERDCVNNCCLEKHFGKSSCISKEISLHNEVDQKSKDQSGGSHFQINCGESRRMSENTQSVIQKDGDSDQYSPHVSCSSPHVRELDLRATLNKNAATINRSLSVDGITPAQSVTAHVSACTAHPRSRSESDNEWNKTANVDLTRKQLDNSRHTNVSPCLSYVENDLVQHWLSATERALVSQRNKRCNSGEQWAETSASNELIKRRRSLKSQLSYGDENSRCSLPDKGSGSLVSNDTRIICDSATLQSVSALPVQQNFNADKAVRGNYLHTLKNSEDVQMSLPAQFKEVNSSVPQALPVVKSTVTSASPKLDPQVIKKRVSLLLKRKGLSSNELAATCLLCDSAEALNSFSKNPDHNHKDIQEIHSKSPPVFSQPDCSNHALSNSVELSVESLSNVLDFGTLDDRNRPHKKAKLMESKVSSVGSELTPPSLVDQASSLTQECDTCPFPSPVCSPQPSDSEQVTVSDAACEAEHIRATLLETASSVQSVSRDTVAKTPECATSPNNAPFENAQVPLLPTPSLNRGTAIQVSLEQCSVVTGSSVVLRTSESIPSRLCNESMGSSVLLTSPPQKSPNSTPLVPSQSPDKQDPLFQPVVSVNKGASSSFSLSELPDGVAPTLSSSSLDGMLHLSTPQMLSNEKHPLPETSSSPSNALCPSLCSLNDKETSPTPNLCNSTPPVASSESSDEGVSLHALKRVSDDLNQQSSSSVSVELQNIVPSPQSLVSVASQYVMQASAPTANSPRPFHKGVTEPRTPFHFVESSVVTELLVTEPAVHSLNSSQLKRLHGEDRSLLVTGDGIGKDEVDSSVPPDIGQWKYRENPLLNLDVAQCRMAGIPPLLISPDRQDSSCAARSFTVGSSLIRPKWYISPIEHQNITPVQSPDRSDRQLIVSPLCSESNYRIPANQTPVAVSLVRNVENRPKENVVERNLVKNKESGSSNSLVPEAEVTNRQHEMRSRHRDGVNPALSSTQSDPIADFPGSPQRSEVTNPSVSFNTVSQQSRLVIKEEVVENYETGLELAALASCDATSSGNLLGLINQSNSSHVMEACGSNVVSSRSLPAGDQLCSQNRHSVSTPQGVASRAVPTELVTELHHKNKEQQPCENDSVISETVQPSSSVPLEPLQTPPSSPSGPHDENHNRSNMGEISGSAGHSCWRTAIRDALQSLQESVDRTTGALLGDGDVEFSPGKRLMLESVLLNMDDVQNTIRMVIGQHYPRSRH